MKPKVYKSRVYDTWMCSWGSSTGVHLNWQDAMNYALDVASAIAKYGLEPSPC